MLAQALRNLNPLALLDPELPGAIPPQAPADEKGINLAAARLNFPNQGMKVQIPVWSNKRLADKVELLLDNNVVAQQTVSDPIELTERATLFVDPNRLKTGAYELTYRVTRFGQQLTNVVAIYANTHGFTALTSDGRVVTWGQPTGGGDSSAVQGQLTGKVTYLATAAP